MEFCRFWLRCVIEGWHVGDGIFGFIEGICFIIAAGAYWVRHEGWLSKWDRWEKWTMKLAFALFVISFLVSALFVAPFIQFKEAWKRKEEAGLTANIYSNKMATLQSQERASDVIKMENAHKAEMQKIEEERKEERRVLLELARTNASLLPVMAARATPPQPLQTTNVSFLDLEQARSALADERFRKEAATRLKENQSRLEALQASEAALATCAPIFDSIIKSFETNLTIIGAKYGDRAISTYNKMPVVLDKKIRDYASIKLKNNSAWNFSVLLEGVGPRCKAEIRNVGTSGIPSLILEMGYQRGQNNIVLILHELSGPHSPETPSFQDANAYAVRRFGEFLALHNEQIPITNAVPSK
jgi:hypothetical protein